MEINVWLDILSSKVNLWTYRGGGGRYHPLSEVFLIFFLQDKTSASDVLNSYLFIPRALLRQV